MARVMEARDFDRLFFGIVASSTSLSKGLTPESRAEFEAALAQYRSSSDRFTPRHQFVNEILLTHAVETFDLYLLHILRLIYSECPELVIEEARLETEFPKSAFDSPNDFFLFLAEKKLQQLGYKGLAQLRSYFEKKLGVVLFKDETIFEDAQLASQVRNLITHNDARVNEIFLKRTSGLKITPAPEIGLRYVVSTEWRHHISTSLDSIVFDFDAIAIQQFRLPSLNRLTSFLSRQ